MTRKDHLILLCRLCLEKDNVDIPIYCETDEEMKQVHKKISTCLAVTISKKDNLPKKICVNCAKKLDSFYQFWKDSIEVEKQLTAWVNNEKPDVISINNKKPKQRNMDESSINNYKTLDVSIVKEESVDTDEETLFSRLKNSGCDISYSADNLVSKFIHCFLFSKAIM